MVCFRDQNVALTSFTFVLLIFGASVLLATSIQPTMDMDYLYEQFNNILKLKNYRGDEFLVFLYYKVSAVGLHCDGLGYLFLEVTVLQKFKLLMSFKFNESIVRTSDDIILH